MPKARKPKGGNFAPMTDEQLEKARSARRDYQRQWQRTHKENVRRNQLNYWLRKAEQQQGAEQS